MGKGLRSMIEDLHERLDYVEGKKNAPKRSFADKVKGTKKIEKEFELPKKIKQLKKKRIKENYALVVYLRTNKSMDIFYAPITDEGVYIKETGIYHMADAGYIHRYQDYPVLIIPEWNICPISEKPKPFSPEKDMKESYESGSWATPQKFIINRMALAQAGLLKKAKMGNKALLLLVIAGIVGIYLLTKAMGGG